MRILFFVRDITDCGGIQQATCNLIRSLLEKRFDIKIEIVSIYHKDETPFFEIPDIVNLTFLFNRRINLHNTGYEIKKRLGKHLKDKSFDYFIVQGSEYSNYIPSKIWKKNVIVCEHGYFGFGHTFGIHWRGVRKALRKATAIVTLTKLDAENFRRATKRNIDIRHIYNAVYYDETDSNCYSLESKKIVSCGSLTKVKGFNRVIRAARIVVDAHPEWKWEIYGDGYLKAYLEQLIKESNLEGKVILKGYERDKSIIFSNKAITVVTSDFEGFGMVLLESMYYKVPIISFDIKYGPREIVESFKNGELVNAFDCEALADRINYLIDNPSVRKKYSDYTIVSMQRFLSDKIADDWINLFEDLKCKV
ncbi:MAG: glycosyltransferase family 4 protein [Dorea sp.]|nr:glycosyltransferase family 4 protein [Dorea sp.]